MELMLTSRGLDSALESHFERIDAELGDFIQTPDLNQSRIHASRANMRTSTNLRSVDFGSDENTRTLGSNGDRCDHEDDAWASEKLVGRAATEY